MSWIWFALEDVVLGYANEFMNELSEDKILDAVLDAVDGNDDCVTDDYTMWSDEYDINRFVEGIRWRIRYFWR